MTDKVQKIREEVEIVVNRRLNLLNGDYFDLNKEADGFTNEIMDVINSLQEEPKFNVGDTIHNKELTVFIYGISKGKYWVKDVSDTFDFGCLEISNQDEWELVEKPVSEDLEKEIEQYCIHHGYLDSFKDCGYTFNEQVGDIARHFANFQKQYMMKDAVNGLVYAQRTNGEVMFRSNYVKKERFEFGDKVKLLVLKEE